jgi:hypothetical protein
MSWRDLDGGKASALERARDVAAMRREDDRISVEQRRRNAVSTKTTKAGPVDRPPALDDLDKPLDQLHEQIGSTLEAIEAARERNEKISRTSAVDTNRFPALKGGK